METLVDAAYSAFSLLGTMHTYYSSFALIRLSYLREITFLANGISGTLRLNDSLRGKQPLYWLHSLLLVIFTSFGGGIVSSLALGLPVSTVTNELILPVCLVCWYAIFVLRLDWLLAAPPVRFLWITLLAVYRTHAVCGAVTLANQTLSPGAYYHWTPFLGPIVIGTLNGAGGAFLPLDRGLTAVANGTPWAMQAAFLQASFYHLLIFDRTGPVGRALRAVLGSPGDTELRTIICTVHLIVLWLQLFVSETVNPLTPLHKLLYLLFQPRGPPTAHSPPGGDVGWPLPARLVLERLLETLRVMAVLMVLLAHVYATCPPTSLPAGNTIKGLALGSSLGACQLLPQVRRCAPSLLVLEEVSSPPRGSPLSLAQPRDLTLRLAVYSNATAQSSSLLFGGADRNWVPRVPLPSRPVWTLNLVVRPSGDIKRSWRTLCETAKEVKKETCHLYMRLPSPSTGALSLVLSSLTENQELLLWQGPAHVCPAGSNVTRLSLINLEPRLWCEGGGIQSTLSLK
jgi:uncharacterized membrane protein YeiH